MQSLSDWFLELCGHTYDWRVNHILGILVHVPRVGIKDDYLAFSSTLSQGKRLHTIVAKRFFQCDLYTYIQEMVWPVRVGYRLLTKRYFCALPYIYEALGSHTLKCVGIIVDQKEWTTDRKLGQKELQNLPVSCLIWLKTNRWWNTRRTLEGCESLYKGGQGRAEARPKAAPNP